MPAWAQSFNSAGPADKFAATEWRFGSGADGLFKMPAEAGPKLYDAVYGSPFGNEILESFVEEAIRQEKLGQRGVMDFLSVSFSSNDVVGHTYGPDSARVHDMSIRTDRLLAKLFDYLDASIGMQHVLVAFTADHGVMPLPETLRDNHMPGGRLSSAALFDPIREALAARFGPGKWVEGTAGSSPYFNLQLIREKNLDREEVERVAADAAEAIPQVARVYTRTQLLRGMVPDDRISQQVMRSYHPRRSGDLEIVLDTYWIRGSSGTTHGTPYSYDTHIPLIFMGPGIRAGRYVRAVALKDLAPSLATLMDIETPSGSEGRALYEMMTAAADR
jgi:arylsulfatase A-like enzyme